MSKELDDWMRGGVVENDSEEARTERRWPGPATQRFMDEEDDRREDARRDAMMDARTYGEEN